MLLVNTMDFFMPCLNAAMTLRRLAKRLAKAVSHLIAMLLLCMGLSTIALAQSTSIVVSDFAVERDEEGGFLNANLAFELPASLEDALMRGMPITFLLQAEVMQERWYWYDKRVALVQRYVRLSYQPLSRRWRVHQSTQPILSSGLGVSLGNSHDNLKDALLAVQKISRWKFAEANQLRNSKQRFDFRFSLDLSQLPQALQFGSLTSNDWALEVRLSQRLDDLPK